MVASKYEDLVAYPESTLKGICGFLGVSFEPKELSYRQHLYVGIGGNRMKNGNMATSSVTKMNICYIADSVVPSRTANSIHVMKICQAYASLGHQVTLIVPNRREGAESGVKDIYAFYGVRPEFIVHKVPFPSWRSSTLYFSVVLPLVAWFSQPDLVHTRGLGVAWGSTRLFQQSTIFEIHQPIPEDKREQYFFKQTIMSPHLQTLVTITHALASQLQPSLSTSTRLLIAPDGVDKTWLQPSLSSVEVRIKLNLANETRRIAVYTGHLYPGRGIELIINLAKGLEDHLFLVVGGQKLDIARYQQQTEGLSNLRFVGFVPPVQVPLYLQAADVLLMPYSSRVETVGGSNIAAFASPMKMFEYMAAGRPILASTLPVLQEILKNGTNALLLPYDQPDDWLEALRKLEQDDRLAESLGRQARLDVRQYTWENRAHYLLTHINK